jgi:hypothetical protein
MSSAKNYREQTAALTFTRHKYPNVYLPPTRVDEAFTGNIGSISTFVKNIETGGGAGIEVGVIAAKLGLKWDTKEGSSITFDLTQPLPKALVLRARLASKEMLETDAGSAAPMDYVLARGFGGIAYPEATLDGSWSLGSRLPLGVVDEVLAEQGRRTGIHRGDDQHPEYWPPYAQTPSRIVVALLGGKEMNHSIAGGWTSTEVTCCIFGTKVKDWSTWTIVDPMHVWFEPGGPSKRGPDVSA